MTVWRPSWSSSWIRLGARRLALDQHHTRLEDLALLAHVRFGLGYSMRLRSTCRRSRSLPLIPQQVHTLKSLSLLALLAVSQLCTTRSNLLGRSFAAQLRNLDHAAALRRRRLLVLAGEIIFAERAADLLEHLGRLALGMQGLARLAAEGLPAEHCLDPVQLVVLSDRRKAHDVPRLLRQHMAGEVIPRVTPGAGATRTTLAARLPKQSSVPYGDNAKTPIDIINMIALKDRCQRAIGQFSGFPAASLPRLRFGRKIVYKILITKTFRFRASLKKIFSLSFPERQGRGGGWRYPAVFRPFGAAAASGSIAASFFLPSCGPQGRASERDRDDCRCARTRARRRQQSKPRRQARWTGSRVLPRVRRPTLG